ncbi:membrane hypothetical protein [Gammaproteobacteria bacterium]
MIRQTRQMKTLVLFFALSLMMVFPLASQAKNAEPINFWRTYPKHYYQKSWFLPLASLTAAGGGVVAYYGAATAASFYGTLQTGALGNLLYSLFSYPFFGNAGDPNKFTGYGFQAVKAGDSPRFLFAAPLYPSTAIGQGASQSLWQKVEQGKQTLLAGQGDLKTFGNQLESIKKQVVGRLDKLDEIRHQSPILELSDENEEDYVALLLMLAQFPDRTQDFVRRAAIYKELQDNADSLPLYLAAVAELRAALLEPKQNRAHLLQAAHLADLAHKKESQVIEPLLAALIAKFSLGQPYREDFLSAVVQFNPDYYSTPNTPYTGYALLGDMASAEGRAMDGLKAYLKAWFSEIQLNGMPIEKARLQAKMAHNFRRLGHAQAANDSQKLAQELIKSDPNALLLNQELTILAGDAGHPSREPTLTEQIIEKYKPSLRGNGFAWPDIPSEKLSHVIDQYGEQMESGERVLFLWDNSALGDARDGFMVTQQALYSHFSLFSPLYRFPLSTLKNLTFIEGSYPEARNNSEWILSFVLGEPPERKATMEMLAEIVKLDSP